MSVDIQDIITCASFCDDQLRGLGVARGLIFVFPLTCVVALTTLSRYRVVCDKYNFGVFMVPRVKTEKRTVLIFILTLLAIYKYSVAPNCVLLNAVTDLNFDTIEDFTDSDWGCFRGCAISSSLGAPF